MADKMNISKAVSSYDVLLDSKSISDWKIHGNYEIFYAHSDITLIINNKVFKLHKNDIVFLPPMCLHVVKIDENSKCNVTTVHLPIYLNNLYKPIIEQLEKLYASNKYLSLSQEEAKHVDSLVSNLNDPLTDIEELDNNIMSIHIGNLLLYLFKLIKSEACSIKNDCFLTYDNSKISGKIKDITEYISSNLQGELSLEKISNKFFVNKSYLSRMFKSEMGFNISTYINFCKINKAINLLLSGRNITDCVSECGFSSHAYFSKNFKEILNITPKEFIKYYC